MPLTAFTDHPASVGESYIEHLQTSSSFGFRMIGGGIACLVHAIFPFWCTKTGSQQVCTLHERMILNRIRQGTDVLVPGHFQGAGI